MRLHYDKVSDFNLIPTALVVTNNQKDKKISTKKLIKEIQKISVIPEYEKKILKNRSDNKFSQKVRNLVSHKVLEKYNLGGVENNNFFLNYFGKKLAKICEKNLSFSEKTNIETIINNKDYKEIFLQAKLDIKFPSFLLEKIENFDFSSRALNIFKELNIKYLGDLVSGVDKYKILSIPSSGKKTLGEITGFLKKNNLDFEIFPFWNNLNNKELIIKKFNQNKIVNNTKNIDEIILNQIKKKSDNSIEKFERKKDILFNRFAINGSFLTLEEIAKKYNITRERVRQIQKKFSNQIKTDVSFLDKILKLKRFIHQNTPISEKVLGDLLIKEKYFSTYKNFNSLQSIIQSFTNFDLDKYSYYFDDNKNTDNNIAHFVITCKKLAKQQKIINNVISETKRQTRLASYCNFKNLIFNVFRERNNNKYANIKKYLKLDDNFYWLDDQNFIFEHTPDSRKKVLNVLKKILFTQKKISYEDFKDSLLSNSRIGMSPPLDILQKICQKEGFKYDNDFIYYSGHETKISENEELLIKIFKNNGDFLSMMEIVDLADKENINLGSLGWTIGQRGWCKKLENNIYCLYGTIFDKEKFENALKKSKQYSRSGNASLLDISWVKERKISIKIKISRTIQLKGFLNIPANWFKILEGTYYHSNSKSEVKINGAIWNLNKILNDFEIDDEIELIFSSNPNVLEVKK